MGDSENCVRGMPTVQRLDSGLLELYLQNWRCAKGQDIPLVRDKGFLCLQPCKSHRHSR